MIRYKFSPEELAADIERQDRKTKTKTPWLVRARKLTAELRKNPKKKISSQWSHVKRVYTDRQQGKCAFCERLLGKHDLSANEIDVEHFRPKNAVAPWPDAKTRAALRLPANFPQSGGKGAGYRLLAYHYLNYASSCKTCNSRLKGNFFPIAGKHRFRGSDPAALQTSERPYLIYPLADFDEDPEDLIGFSGYVAEPARPVTDRYRHDRGRVTITFFRLNDERDDLLLMRAKQ